MANIEKVIEKLESLGFIEVLLSTTEVLYCKGRMKIKLFEKSLMLELTSRGGGIKDRVRVNFDREDIFIWLENIAQW